MRRIVVRHKRKRAQHTLQLTEENRHFFLYDPPKELKALKGLREDLLLKWLSLRGWIIKEI